MASFASRTFTRVAARASCRLSVSSATREAFRRSYASGPSSSSSNKTFYTRLGGAIVFCGSAYYVYTDKVSNLATKPSSFTSKVSSATTEDASKVGFTPKTEDYQEVYNAIAKRLADEDEYDDGSYGPVLLRLGWHASGTYDAETKTGGSNGATMRFAPEGDHGANAGLKAARDFLEPVKEQFPWITYSDLWTLSAVCAIQEMHGPSIQWRPGRSDRDLSFCTPDGRLPDASKTEDHLRAIFGRMGFNDQEIVALSGAHALGRCHTDRSGFEGPWTFSPTIMTNDYYKLLVGGESDWKWRTWDGPKQYEDKQTKTLMMLPTDMALVKDEGFKATTEKYAKDNEAFFADFSNVVCKLFELGVPFETQGSLPRMTFKSLATAE